MNRRRHWRLNPSLPAERGITRSAGPTSGIAMKHHLIFIVSLALVALGGATCRPKSTGNQGGSALGFTNLVDGLRGAGAKVEPAGEVSQPFFSVKGQIIKVNGSDVQVFEYANATAADAQAKSVSPDGSVVGKSRVGWIAPPHFYKKGKIIALYLGADATVIRALEAILGPQFAGK